MEWTISDQEISSAEDLLLPVGAHFSEDARAVIRCWTSTDVSACPGSGKTTVLLAKLKLLADRMPLHNGAGICVLSHTNVAVDEIRRSLSTYADKLMSYPNYIGTIQSFVDKYVTMQYLRARCKTNIQFVGTEEYGKHLSNMIWADRSKTAPYKTLQKIVYRIQKSNTSTYRDEKDCAQHIVAGKDGIYHRNRKVAGFESDSGKQFLQAKWDMLVNKGIIAFNDSYLYADDAINDLTNQYTELFCERFKYVFVDEYQDCNSVQREALNRIFDPTKCCVIHIGDPDQAIYQEQAENPSDWIPSANSLPIISSCRYTQEIANIITPLRSCKARINSSIGECGIKPVIIVFDETEIHRVIGEFVSQLEQKKLYDTNKVYKVIGAVGKETLSGLKIGSYWPEYDATKNDKSKHNYWTAIDEIRKALETGKAYFVDQAYRAILCDILRYLDKRQVLSQKIYTISSIKSLLKDDIGRLYSQHVYEMTQMCSYGIDDIDKYVRKAIKDLLDIIMPNGYNFSDLPSYYTDCPSAFEKQHKSRISNIFIDPIRGRKIEFSTIHGVKGETHEATLYLETEVQNGSDLRRILQYYGIGNMKTNQSYERSRKLAYVGMSRPRKLLCVAMRAETYRMCKGFFDQDCEIIYLIHHDTNSASQ